MPAAVTLNPFRAPTRPHYPSRAERFADGGVHVAGVLFAAAAGGTALGLSIWQGGFAQAWAVMVYALCMLATLACSALYNLAQQPARQRVLRRLDHAAIFLMIAGSYTPFTTQRFEGAWAVGMTAAVWAVALLGVAGKLFLPGLSKKLWVAVYVLLGWMVLIAIEPMARGVSLPALILLVVGGGIYTLGVAIYVWDSLPFRRAIWHGFVLAAAGVHYAAVLVGVVFGAQAA